MKFHPHFCTTCNRNWHAETNHHIRCPYCDSDLTICTSKETKMQIPVSFDNYMSLSDAYDKHSKVLMSIKGNEYSSVNDFLEMENRLGGMLNKASEFVSLVMAGKHITSIGIIFDKVKPEEIDLAKLDERVRDACNLLKIASAFIHAKQNDFTLHLGKDEKCLNENAPQAS